MREIKRYLNNLVDTPPWDWPGDTAQVLLGILGDEQAGEPERALAAELAGDFVVINDELTDVLLALVQSGEEAERVRCQAVLSLGPVLEYADGEGFEDAGMVPIGEPTFRRIQETLHTLYLDARVPPALRRRILEASVRAPQPWHEEAICAACSSDDEAWRLTAVFCMRFVRGFEAQILVALTSGNPDIRREAVLAAGVWEVDAAWPPIVALVTAGEVEKSLRLAAIESAASIRPQEAAALLEILTLSDDEDISEAAHEAIAMASSAGDDDQDTKDEDAIR